MTITSGGLLQTAYLSTRKQVPNTCDNDTLYSQQTGVSSGSTMSNKADKADLTTSERRQHNRAHDKAVIPKLGWCNSASEMMYS